MSSDPGDSEKNDAHDGESEPDVVEESSTPESRTDAVASSTEGQRKRTRDQESGGAGEAAGRALDSARNRLSTPAAKSQLKYVIGLFALVGAGYGVTGILILKLLGGGGSVGARLLTGLFSLALVLVVLSIGPVIAVYTGLNAADGLYQEPRTAYLTSFVSDFVGYFVMVLIAVLLIGVAAGGGGAAQTDQGQFGGGGTAADTGGNPVDIVNLLVPMILLSIPVGLVGVGSSYLHRPTDSEESKSILFGG